MENKRPDGGDGAYTDGLKRESPEIGNGIYRAKAGKSDGGVTHADDASTSNAADSRTRSPAPRMCSVG